MMRALRKDNSGYHLHHMFVGNNYTLIVALLTLEVTGSEGTLGVVTRVAISLVPRPSYSRVALVKVSANQLEFALGIVSKIIGLRRCPHLTK